MAEAAYIAVDWGTTSFRLWLMDGDHRVLAERRSGEGMTTAAETGFSQVLETHLAAVSAGADLPVIICGMAGARQGWVEAGYVDAPAPLAAVLDGAVRVPGETRDIRILPGIAQRAETAPDVMRGEETQLLGALGPSSTGKALVCMPGTHSKWVNVEDSRVTSFASFMTGEVFDVITKHSILKHAVAGAEAFDASHPAFQAAVVKAAAEPALLTSLIFTARSGQLLHGLDATGAAARLSGTLIGAEIAGGIHAAGRRPDLVRLVASGRLQGLYEGALAALGLAFETIDADLAVRQGLAAAAQSLFLSHARIPA
ncbi:2-dehydro-3-deoxygalactonokinase [Rhizobium straminoryzae]|uniref:2-dehydro-3-deoxygalactonokinase n=1 Tax=Rhizobium straminoryzae TaxID=1387186 RepID=A0A549TBL5_9HYPH|nr:2-dehydro-3-deoxygalactonokinase [Rhizobium straminoryzae]TRL39285.1 2-dehydro-3-deoxygalactonokinase [Rhizobium straminoryzae]